jgi:hypothetical protein
MLSELVSTPVSCYKVTMKAINITFHTNVKLANIRKNPVLDELNYNLRLHLSHMSLQNVRHIDTLYVTAIKTCFITSWPCKVGVTSKRVSGTL